MIRQLGPAPWGPRLLAVAAGLAAGLAHPPFGLLPGLLGYALLLRLGDSAGPRPRRSALLRGWLAGLGYFAVGAWWIVEPFMVDARRQGWMAPFALVLMAGGLALFWGLALVAYRSLRPRGFGRVLVFAGCLSGAEWLRGHLLTGFPWNLPGETWQAGSPPSQAASVLGAYGLTWLTVSLCAAPALLLDPATRRRRLAAAAAMLGVLGGLYATGWARLAAPAPRAERVTLIRVVQADIDQRDKWRPENLPAIFAAYVELTRRPAPRRPDIVVWPEGALPAVFEDLMAPGAGYAGALAEALDPGQALLMGANHAQASPGGEVRYFNSLVALRREGYDLRLDGIYHKHRLVPFGEFLPFGTLATRLGIRSLVHMPDDFTPGPPPRPLRLRNAPAVQPLICYEALFPGFTRGAAARSGVRPAWILNVSNDAWFGRTSGPLQHLNIASYRAIEEGLPIVRATPTGVSAVIDAYGRPVEKLGLGSYGVIDALLPPPLESTVYGRFGDAVFLLLLMLSMAPIFKYGVRRPAVG